MNAQHFKATNEEYHARAGVSHSQLEVFLDDPGTYYRRFVTKEESRSEPTASMRFGSAAHDWLLEGGKNIVEIPAAVLGASGRRAGAPWKKFAEANADSILMKAAELEPFKQIEANINAHEKAAQLVTHARRFEYAIEWTNTEFDLLCRCRLDFLGDVCICDFKTARSVKPFEFTGVAYKLGYHRQADWYIDGLEALTGKRLPFVFAAAKNTPPYTVECIDLDDDYMELAAIENREAMRRLKECMESDVWESPTHGKIVTISPPNFTKYSSQWELEET